MTLFKNERSISNSTYPLFEEMLPTEHIEDRKYRVSFARSAAELEAIQRLRFEVFNIELGEGLEESFQTGRDEDRFDPLCHHLLVTERASDEVVGTYRLMTQPVATRFGGFYSADEFDLSQLPAHVLDGAVEIGRACIGKKHRNSRVLFLLWKGLATYMERNDKRYLFGCCSLTSQDPAEGYRVMEYLRANGYVHPEYRVLPQPDWVCYEPGQTFEVGGDVDLPRLFRLYLRYRAQICGPPALDRFFKTIDYFCLFDRNDMDRDLYRLFFE